MSTLMTGLLPARAPAVAAAVGFLAIAAFQAALALGAPLGRAAWGGAHEQLPTGLRIASAFAVWVWALAALIVLRRAGVEVSPLPEGFVRWGTWILVGVLPLGALMTSPRRAVGNASSGGRWRCSWRRSPSWSRAAPRPEDDASTSYDLFSSPNGIRTRVSTLRGWCPRPLDDGTALVLGRREV